MKVHKRETEPRYKENESTAHPPKYMPNKTDETVGRKDFQHTGSKKKQPNEKKRSTQSKDFLGGEKKAPPAVRSQSNYNDRGRGPRGKRERHR